VLWRLENQRARLLQLSLGSTERQVLLPEPWTQRFIDPPPPRNPVSKPLDGEPAARA
jgi:hypothetical protein